MALSAGLRLVRWARRPAVTAEDRRFSAQRRRRAKLRELARDEWVQEQRNRDVAKYLYRVRPMI